MIFTSASTSVVRFVTSSSLDSLGIKHGFCQRSGGVSSAPFASLNIKVSELVDDSVEYTAINQQRAIKVLGLDNKTKALLQLKGGTEICVVESAVGDRTMLEVDGAATAVSGMTLGLAVADCLPVLLADKTAGVIGIAHAGWQGAAGQVTTKVVRLMTKLGAKPKQIVAAIGPSICGRCYEVKDDVSHLFEDRFVSKVNSQQYLDLWAAVEAELKKAGVNQIDNLRLCTFEHSDDFFSARKEKTTGRFLAVISL